MLNSDGNNNFKKGGKKSFRRISPFEITVKKAHKARTRWYRGPFRRFINIRCLKKLRNGLDIAIKENKDIYIYCINA